MAKLSAIIIVAVFMASMFIIDAEKEHREKREIIQVMTLQQFLQMICQNYGANVPLCSADTTTTTTITVTTTPTNVQTSPITPSLPASSGPSSTTQSSTTSSTTVAAATTTTTLSASALERAHWCRFSNGSYLSLLQTFMYTNCDICQCTQAHTISCTTLQCMTTFCIDGSAPVTQSGQCCSQCSYDPPPTACIVNGISFPHGTVLKQTSNNVQCWCELGNVECRKAVVSALSNLSFWGENTAVYIIIIVVCALFIIGTLTCSCGACFFYYYYKRNQQATQEAYEHYYNTAGWQPMSEDGVVIEQNDEEKKAEAEQAQYEEEYPTGNDEQYIPPPYALYNGTYLNEQPEKEQKYI
jgi:hypothetical protein